MAKPYDNDLHQKVSQAIEQDGLPKGEASKLLRISRNTIDLWFKRKAEMAQLWDRKVSTRTISSRLAELNWSRKKKDLWVSRTR